MMGLEAKTIHRLREFNPSVMGFKGDLDKPLECSNISQSEALRDRRR